MVSYGGALYVRTSCKWAGGGSQRWRDKLKKGWFLGVFGNFDF